VVQQAVTPRVDRQRGRRSEPVEAAQDVPETMIVV
jgi:hypothetical protein